MNNSSNKSSPNTQNPTVSHTETNNKQDQPLKIPSVPGLESLSLGSQSEQDLGLNNIILTQNKASGDETSTSHSSTTSSQDFTLPFSQSSQDSATRTTTTQDSRINLIPHLNSCFKLENKESNAMPKNITELAAMKEIGLSFGDISNSRYSNIIENKSKDSLFTPLSQPVDYRKTDNNNNFCSSKLTLCQLIDPKGWHTRFKPPYPKETFTFITKFAKLFEERGELSHSNSRIEASYILSTLVRIAEAFQVLATLNSAALALIDPKNFNNQKDSLDSFKETTIFAMNALAQEIYCLEPLLRSAHKDRKHHSYDTKILKLFKKRLSQAPILSTAPSLMDEKNDINKIFQNNRINLEREKSRYIRELRDNLITVSRKRNRNGPRDYHRNGFQKRRYNGRGRGRNRGRGRGRGRGSYLDRNHYNSARGNNRANALVNNSQVNNSTVGNFNSRTSQSSQIRTDKDKSKN